MARSKTKLAVRLLVPMMLLVLFQIVIFFSVLIIGGEFTYVREYAYSTFADKAETRRNYLEAELQQKVLPVQESAYKIGSMIEEITAGQNAAITDISTNKELDRLIMESAADSMIELMRRSMVNDVYLILETGDLYGSEGGGKEAKAALYIRDLDVMTDAGYEDLLMEIGFSSVSQKFGISLDSGWTLHFEPDPSDTRNFDFYYNTLDTAKKNRSIKKQEDLGYWSGFSKFSGNAAASMKYTVPLIAGDGTVYGVLGIGLTENTILDDLPASDFKKEVACYVLGKSTGEDTYDIITHSGISFRRLLGDAEKLRTVETMEQDICGFDAGDGLAGSVQEISLYSAASPYLNDRWALIAAADESSVLRPYVNLIRMLVVAASISLAISILVVFITSRNVVKPITEAIRTMNSKHKYSEVIRFEPSNIYELDNMTDAITQLQINVQDFSSQVSQMIRIADVGLGTFLYDSADDSVFVGQSLLKQLDLKTEPEEDILMTRTEFLENISSEETKAAITEGIDKIAGEESQTDYIKEYSIAQRDMSMRWMRLSLVNNKNKSIGILQDITNEIMEKKRIEYERDYDSTTGLLNRNAYYNQIERLFQHPDSLKVTAFIMLDLDNLKYVNDTYGHDFGDDYIKTAATSLKRFQYYGGIVSRLSGDEFNVCLSGFDTKEEVRGIIESVRSQLLQSYCLLADGTHFKIRASAGVAWYPDDGNSYEVLMKYADFAMYTIKHSTKGELAEFDRSAYDNDSILITGVEEMNRIIDECRVRYAFHSIVNAKTGEIYGYEALMRPQSNVFQSPLDLLRIAKTSARLNEIERMTWTRALAEFKEQIEAGRIPGDCHVFVNSISNCVLDPSDVKYIEDTFPDLLPNVVLEILEGEISNESYNERKINRMKKWEAQIALDDFGTGYNSEYALITMDPNIIKIDRSIISGCDKDISRRTIISNLVKLVKTRNILVLAEGVETEDELQTVISCGVDLLQGYYFTRPLFEPEPLKPELTEKIRRMANPTFETQ
ncbi:MAG: GGDEF and EAL domain-containing protein [Oscillospiraceae bacterium]|nr:GGDEF and EAL domain-containing protein [Oscillospiraceae bacterium]